MQSLKGDFRKTKRMGVGLQKGETGFCSGKVSPQTVTG